MLIYIYIYDTETCRNIILYSQTCVFLMCLHVSYVCAGPVCLTETPSALQPIEEMPKASAALAVSRSRVGLSGSRGLLFSCLKNRWLFKLGILFWKNGLGVCNCIRWPCPSDGRPEAQDAASTPSLLPRSQSDTIWIDCSQFESCECAVLMFMCVRLVFG